MTTIERDMPQRIIHVVGLQKSGTSLLVRLLENSGHAQFLDGRGKTEGGIDWGNRPSFSPTGWPAGTIYQRSNGNNGHEIGAEDATPDICTAVRKQVTEKLRAVPTHYGISKTPYDTVRLPWVRAVLPDLFIVGIVRRPAPNVYSLWKRFQGGAETRPPEDGWWGVKPRNWRRLVSEDKVAQIAWQWDQVNQKMWDDRTCLDMVITYDELCSSPADVVASVLSKAGAHPLDVALNHDALPSCDEEYVYGGRLLPRRQEWAATNDLVLSQSDEPELAPFTADQIRAIEHTCSETARMLGVACR